MTAMELLGDLSTRMYQRPLSEIRWNGGGRDLTNPLTVPMLILDMHLEVMMNGMQNFLGNSTGRYAAETVVALQMVDCETDAALLRRILEVAEAAGMNHAAVQADQSGLAEYQITTWRSRHGARWDGALAQIDQLAAQIDYDRVINGLAAFTERNFTAIQAALHQA